MSCCPLVTTLFNLPVITFANREPQYSTRLANYSYFTWKTLRGGPTLDSGLGDEKLLVVASHGTGSQQKLEDPHVPTSCTVSQNPGRSPRLDFRSTFAFRHFDVVLPMYHLCRLITLLQCCHSYCFRDWTPPKAILPVKENGASASLKAKGNDHCPKKKERTIWSTKSTNTVNQTCIGIAFSDVKESTLRFRHCLGPLDWDA